MQTRTNITQSDLLAFSLFTRRSGRNNLYRDLAKALFPAGALIFTAVLLMVRFVPQSLRSPWTILPLLALLPASLLLSWCISRRQASDAVALSVANGEAAASLGDQEISLEEDGIKISSPSRQSSHPWSEVDRVMAEDDYGYIFLNNKTTVIIPARSFPDREAFSLFVKMAVISHWNHEQHKQQPQEPKASDSAPAPVPVPSKPLISMGPVSPGFVLSPQR